MYTLLVLALLGFIMPSGAALTHSQPVDDIWEENELVVAPADGPNGDYADIGDDGKLAVDLSAPGVNTDSQTLIRRVFVVANTGSSSARFWLTQNTNHSLTFYESVSSGHIDQATIAQRSLHGDAHARTLAPGEELTVSVYIDTTTQAADIEPVILKTISLHAQTEDPTTTTTTTTPAPTTTATPTTTPTVEEAGTVEVEFENESGDAETEGTEEPEAPAASANYTVEDVDTADIGEAPTEPDRGPTAVITNRSADQPEPAEQADDRDQSKQSFDLVSNEGETVDLSATQSYIPHSTQVDRERKIADAKNITVQSGYEDQPATLRFRVSRAKLGGVDPANARVGRLTDRGWQLLETRVIAETDEFVLLQARTPGFSTFAVFSSPDVTYEWTLPDGSTYIGENIRTQFDEPGRYNVTLRVTDAAGGYDIAEHRILVNDNPRISLDSPENVTAGDTVTLNAIVANEYGNTTVRWRLPNGETAVGQNATYVAPAGEHEVTATVIDEYGARNGTTATLGTADTARLEPLTVLFGDQFPVLTWVTIAGLLALAIFGVVHRQGVPAPRRILRLPASVRFAPWRRGPRIDEFAVPHWNPAQSRFEIPALTVVDPQNELDRIELLIHTLDGGVLARKTIDLHRQTRYTATPEVIQGIPADVIQPQTEYETSVRAINTRDKSVTKARSVAWRMPTDSFRHRTPG